MTRRDASKGNANAPALDATISTRDNPSGVGDHVRYFGEYELLEEIARGGMGVVFKARQVKLNRIVALKMILSGAQAGDEEVQRFKTEAEAAANLDHPGIVPIFEIGEHQGQHYFSMGYVNGRSLAERVKDGPFPPREAAELLKSVAAAMAYAHDKGVIHRDLKPANVLLDANGEPRVTDFGLAKQVESESDLTRIGSVMGTPSYMPPEQAAGKTDQVGPRSDVYSLGAVLYCLLTGRPPFQSSNPASTLRQVMEMEPVAPRDIDASIPRDIETITMKALMKAPDRRYESAAALAEDLEHFLKGEPILARRPSLLYRTRRFVSRNRQLVTVAGLAASMALLGLFATIGWLNSRLGEAQAELELERKSAEANRLGGITLADESSLHCRRFPGELSLTGEDHGWRFHIPAGKSYRIMLYTGPFADEHPLGVDPEILNLWPLSTIGAHPDAREVVFTMSFRSEFHALVAGEPKREVVKVYTGGIDPARSRLRITFPLPPIVDDVFEKGRPALKQYDTPGRKETLVMPDPPGPMMLVKVTAWDYPPEVVNGRQTVGKWMKTIDHPGYGYVVWIEPAPSSPSTNKAAG